MMLLTNTCRCPALHVRNASSSLVLMSTGLLQWRPGLVLLHLGRPFLFPPTPFFPNIFLSLQSTLAMLW